MYSILPAAISLLFLGFGFFSLSSLGIGRISVSFFLLCLTTFFWQGTWSVLFQVSDPDASLFLVKFGYFFILFLPTSLYHFLTEISEQKKERRYVYLSYAFALVLVVFLFSTDLFISGYYHYFWGNYPKAGLLHPLHILQTVIVVNRGLYITYVAQKYASHEIKMRLRLCLAGILVFFFAAIDYLCNYGFEFYPPGVVFIAICLGFFTFATVKYDLLNPMALAASVAHEMRTPLATIRNQMIGITRHLPDLLKGYLLAVENQLITPSISHKHLTVLSETSDRITNEVKKSNAMIDMLLASAVMNRAEVITFEKHFIGTCIAEALERYPFENGEKEKISVSIQGDFEFKGSDTLMVVILFNLLKNSICALRESGKGEIQIQASSTNGRNYLFITDTGTGIPEQALPYIFDNFFSTKRHAGGTGVGLAFCRKVMESFNGNIQCHSVAGQFTKFTLEFPIA